jgi:lipooligosaccharide transport system permease protein
MSTAARPTARASMLSRALRMVERNATAYRHAWVVIVSGFAEPLLYLLGVGYGVGTLVGTINQGNGESLPYAVFVAPAMLASTAMNGAVYETTFNFFYKLKHAKLYEAVLSTPMGVADIIRGEVLWGLLRGLAYVVAFIVVMAALGLTRSPLALLAIPACVVISCAFACVGVYATTFIRDWPDFDLVQLVLMPLFLFSATFYPLTAYPAPLQWVMQLTPLYHGVHLVRGLTIGRPDAAMLLDLVYLAVMASLAMWAARRRLSRLLVT